MNAVNKKQKIKQVAAGLLLIVGGIIPAILENDGTVAVLTTPLGIFLMLTRERVVD